MIGNGQNNVIKTQIDQWTDQGFCFQYNQIVSMPDVGISNKYFLFNPSGVVAGIILHIAPLMFTNVEDGPVIVNYYAGSDYTGGTPLSLLNRNANSLNITDVVVTEDPTGTVLGLKTSANKIATGGALPSQSGGGSSREAKFFIGNNALPILIEIVNSSGATVDGEVFFEFCEVPERFN